MGIFQATPTKSALKKVLKKRFITVNNQIATTATYITGGESIRLSIAEKVSQHREFKLPLQVLFEDEYLAAIHKPAGILVSGNRLKTIANALPQNLGQSSLPDTTLPQPVHRLDYATTGILLVGKTADCIRRLNKMFEDKEIIKTYLAVSIGPMTEGGYITSDIDSKASQTEYSVIQSVPSKKYGQLNLLELKPLTGRKHQLRIHLASIDNPILGDREYGIEGLVLKGKGLYLHAYSLNFIHPFTNQNMLIKDELHHRFTNIFGSTKVI